MPTAIARRFAQTINARGWPSTIATGGGEASEGAVAAELVLDGAHWLGLSEVLLVAVLDALLEKCAAGTSASKGKSSKQNETQIDCMSSRRETRCCAGQRWLVVVGGGPWYLAAISARVVWKV
jgi:hypothetical protein